MSSRAARWSCCCELSVSSVAAVSARVRACVKRGVGEGGYIVFGPHHSKGARQIAVSRYPPAPPNTRSRRGTRVVSQRLISCAREHCEEAAAAETFRPVTRPCPGISGGTYKALYIMSAIQLYSYTTYTTYTTYIEIYIYTTYAIQAVHHVCIHAWVLAAYNCISPQQYQRTAAPLNSQLPRDS